MTEALHIFVYGTLKSGSAAHERYCAGARTVESARVHGRLYVLPEGYPILWVGDTRDWVCGELLSFEAAGDRLIALDRYEDCPGMYRRDEVPVQVGESWRSAWAYVCPGDPAELERWPKDRWP